MKLFNWFTRKKKVKAIELPRGPFKALVQELHDAAKIPTVGELSIKVDELTEIIQGLSISNASTQDKLSRINIRLRELLKQTAK